VSLAAAALDLSEKNCGRPDLHFRFRRQAPVAPCDFSRTHLSISDFSNGRRHQFVGL
jgi:hypothetical protein